MTGVLRDLRYSFRSLARTPGVTAALLFSIALGLGSAVTIHAFIRGLVNPRDRLVSIVGRGLGPVSYEDYLSLKRRLKGVEWTGAAQISQRAVLRDGRQEILTVAAVTPALARALPLPLGIYSDQPADLRTTLPEDSRNARRVWVLARLRPGASIDRLQGFQIIPYTGLTPEAAERLARMSTLLRAAAALVFFIAGANAASLLLGRASARLRETSLRAALGASRGRLARAVLADSIVISAAGGALGVLFAVWVSKILPALLFQEDAAFLASVRDLPGMIAASAAGIALTIVCGLLPLIELRHDRPAVVLQRENGSPSRTARAIRTALAAGQMSCCCLLVIAAGMLYDSLRGSLRTSAARRLGEPVLATVEARPDAGLRYYSEIERTARAVSGATNAAWVSRIPGSRPAWQAFRIEPHGLPLRDVVLDAAAFTADSFAMLRLPPKAGRLFGFADRGCRVAVVNEEAAGALFGGEAVGRSVFEAAGGAVEIIGVVAARGPGRHRPTLYYDYTHETGPAPRAAAPSSFRAPVASKLPVAELDVNVVSPNWFGLMGWPVAAGRVFAEPSSLGGCRVAVVNQEAADLYFGGKAVGASVIDEVGRRTEIIGVVRPVPLGAFQRRTEPAIYFPQAQDFPLRMTLVLATPRATRPMLAELSNRLDDVPGRRGPAVVKTLEAHLNQTALAPLRIAAMIGGASAAIALLLGVVGLYGALSDAARRRSRDLAIRIALGARRRDVVAQVLREGGRVAVLGSSAGVLASLLLVSLLRRIAPGSAAPSVWVWIAGPAMLETLAVLASVLPARRALMLDPLRILRDNN